MSYKVVLWTLAAVLLVAVIAVVDLYDERREAGPVFIGSKGPVTEEQVRLKMAADGWSNVLIARGALLPGHGIERSIDEPFHRRFSDWPPSGW